MMDLSSCPALKAISGKRSRRRVSKPAMLLMSRSAYRRDALSWMSLLVAAGGQDTYIRAYRGAVDTENVVEFMMLDRLFPRSVFHSLGVAEKNLNRWTVIIAVLWVALIITLDLFTKFNIGG